MKKLLIPLTVLLLLLTASCTDGNETTEPETHPPVEITTAAPVDLNVVSPRTMDVSLPEGIEIKISDIDFDSFEEIEAEDSVFPGTNHDKILKSENAQFFFLSGDIKIHAVYFIDGSAIPYTVSYNTETGYAEFIGDVQKSWYFDKNGQLRCFVFTYDFDGESDAPIYTFYTPEGEKEVARTIDGWYNTSYDLLTNDEIMDYLDKYSGVSEATAEYKPSSFTGK